MKYAVIGLGFGDEGKGILTDYLCSIKNSKPLVVRYSGGSQAGHTVVHNGVRHVFSNFGSGSLRDVPTFWSKLCVMDPLAILNELDVLKEKGINPKLYIDPHCAVITPMEKSINQDDTKTLKHGSCGAGIGATYQREEEHYSIKFKDLFYPKVLKTKLYLLFDKYSPHISLTNYNLFKDSIVEFLDICKELVDCDNVEKAYLQDHRIIIGEYGFRFNDIIFESSQGLMLDQEIGFFPHVTRSYVGTKSLMTEKPLIYLVTRAYQTRHGNGPMTNTEYELNIKENPNETNIDNKYQGKFRKSILDLDLLKYAMESDPYIDLYGRYYMAITCLDQVEGQWKYTYNNVLFTCQSEDDFVRSIKEILGIEKILRFRSGVTPTIYEMGD